MLAEGSGRMFGGLRAMGPTKEQEGAGLEEGDDGLDKEARALESLLGMDSIEERREEDSWSSSDTRISSPARPSTGTLSRLSSGGPSPWTPLNDPHPQKAPVGSVAQPPKRPCTAYPVAAERSWHMSRSWTRPGGNVCHEQERSTWGSDLLRAGAHDKRAGSPCGRLKQLPQVIMAQTFAEAKHLDLSGPPPSSSPKGRNGGLAVQVIPLLGHATATKSPQAAGAPLSLGTLLGGKAVHAENAGKLLNRSWSGRGPYPSQHPHGYGVRSLSASPSRRRSAAKGVAPGRGRLPAPGMEIATVGVHLQPDWGGAKRMTRK
mmetsp:Transcript_11906/g.27713  ORF Transcript_11906/g.27713 Transcript_11906/m.27713 type:complete len:318 (+) Transcript_11906:122-1075(+)